MSTRKSTTASSQDELADLGATSISSLEPSSFPIRDSAADGRSSRTVPDAKPCAATSVVDASASGVTDDDDPTAEAQASDDDAGSTLQYH